MSNESYQSSVTGSSLLPTRDGVNSIVSAIDVTLNHSITSPVKFFQEVNFTTAGRKLNGPAANVLSVGGPPMVVRNVGTNAFNYCVHDGSSTVVTIQPQEIFVVYVINNASSNGAWGYFQISIAAAASLPALLAGFGLTASGGQLNVNPTALAGNGLTTAGAGQPLDVGVDNSTVEINSDQLRVKDGGITGAKIANATITADKLAAGLSLVQKFTGSQNGMNITNLLSVSTPGVPNTTDRYNRFTQVLEEQPGTNLSNSSLDFDLADRNFFDIENYAPATGVTPSDNGTNTVNTTIPLATDNISNPGGKLFFYNSIVPAIGMIFCVQRGAAGGYQTKQLTYPGENVLFPGGYAATLGNSIATVYDANTFSEQFTGDATKLADNKYLFVAPDSGGTNISARSYNVNGSGSPSTIGNATSAVAISRCGVCENGSGSALLVYEEGGSLTTIRARMITVPDVGAPTFGTVYTAVKTGGTASGGGSGFETSYKITKMATDVWLVTYASSTSPTLLFGRIITNSAGVLTIGAETTLDTAATSIDHSNTFPIALSATSFVVFAFAFNSGGPNRNCREITATISGTTITVQATNTLGDSGSGTQRMGACFLTSTKAFIAYTATGSTAQRIGVRDYTTIAAPGWQVGPTLTSYTANLSSLSCGYNPTVNVIGLVIHTTNGVLFYNYAGGNSLVEIRTIQDLGFNLTLGAQGWTINDLGSVVEGNSGYVRITGFAQNATGGTAQSSAGTAGNAFDDNTATVTSAGTDGWVGYDFGSNQTVRLVGIRFNSDGYRSFVLQNASDALYATAATGATITNRWFKAGQYQWFAVTSQANQRYFRVLGTGSSSMDVQDVMFNFGLVSRAQTAYADFAGLTTITNGNWQLERIRFTNAGVMEGGTPTNEVATTNNTGRIDTSLWEDIDLLATLTRQNVFGGLPQFVVRNTADNSQVYRFDSSWACTIYKDTADGNKLKAQMLAISGSTLTPTGSPFVISASSINIFRATVLDSTKIFVCFLDGSTNTGQVLINTAGSFSAGSPSTVFPGSGGEIALSTVDATHVIYANRDTTDSNRGKARCIEISGSSINVLGTLATFETTATSEIVMCAMDTGKFLLHYQYVPAGNQARAIACTVNTAADTVTFGSAVSTATVDLDYATVAQIGTDRALLTYRDNTPAFLGAVITTAGTVVTVNTPVNITGSGMTSSNQVSRGLLSVDGTLVLRILTSTDVLNSMTVQPIVVTGTTLTQYGYLSSGRMKASWTNSIPNLPNTAIMPDGVSIAYAGIQRGPETAAIAVAGYADFSPCFAFSWDGRTTWDVWDYRTAARRSVASNLASVHGGVNGTWRYRLENGTWTDSSPNTMLGALKQAAAINRNRVWGDVYLALGDADWNTLGWTKSPTSTIDVAVFMNETDNMIQPNVSGSDMAAPNVSLLTWNYTSRSKWVVQPPSEYEVDLELNTAVRVTKLGAGPDNIFVSVLYPT